MECFSCDKLAHTTALRSHHRRDTGVWHQEEDQLPLQHNWGRFALCNKQPFLPKQATRGHEEFSLGKEPI